MTVEQELNLLANKYGNVALEEAVKDYLSKSVNNMLKQKWDSICLHYGLQTQDFNRQFSNGREVFYLKEIKTSNRKYPIIAERADGKMFKFPVDVIKSYLRGSI